MKEVVIVEAKRTAIGDFLGCFARVGAVDLATNVAKALLLGFDKSCIDGFILGQVFQAGVGQNSARQVLLHSGIDQGTPAVTVNKVCGSAMKAIHFAYQAIALGEAEVIVAGGTENMSQAGHLLPANRLGQKLGDLKLEDLLLKDGLTCAVSQGIHMGITAENLAKKHNISRKQQDEFACYSQAKASLADKKDRFVDEIVPVTLKQKRGKEVVIDRDAFIKHDANFEAMQKLQPVFKPEGTVTAANASGINDGAALVLMMSLDKARKLGLDPLVRVMGFAAAGVDPKIMGIGPVAATRQCLARVGWSIKDLDLIESNEAFAAQALAVDKELGWDTSKINVNGGAIALGHPIGASGARIVTTLIHEMRRADKKHGLATMCVGGGQGIASAFELF